MVDGSRAILAGVLAMAMIAAPGAALAQQTKADQDAVGNADDAFGTSVGLETTGIYNENSVRGFSTLAAGNARIEGIYFDPVGLLTQRIKAGQSIRVGYAALQYPFPAPTGIADNSLRSAGDRFAAGTGFHLQQYGSYIGLADLQVPVIEDTLSVAVGASHGKAVQVYDDTAFNYSVALRPILRLGSVEIAPFWSANYVRDADPRPLVIMDGPEVPDLPPGGYNFGSSWAKESEDKVNYGVTTRAAITGRLSVRAGLFRSSSLSNRGFTEIFRVSDPADDARHIAIAEPKLDVHSWSGEAQVAYRLSTGRSRHRIIAGFRGRERYTESGGSDIRDLGLVPLGVRDTDLRPDFRFSAVDRGTIRQTALMLGYIGAIEGIGRINLGLQRADFRSRFTDGAGLTNSRLREKHWLYNASIGIELARDVLLFGGTQRGLEDSGVAPERATNRGEQLRAALSTQYEAGLHWNFGLGQLVISGFEITKPLFSFDASDRFVRLGSVRHRGGEVSLSGTFMEDRLDLLVGLMLMKPRVSGPGLEQGLVGPQPVGTRGTRLSVDATYKTDMLSGFTPTLNLTYQGKRPLTAATFAELDGKQVFGGSRVTVDLGFRQPLKLGRYPASLRAKVQNMFDQRQWFVLASNTLLMSDRRRFIASLLVDF